MKMRNENVKMADISAKPVTLREAIAQASISLRPQTLKLIANNKLPKGDVLTIAKCAGILAAKKVDELIPLCHTLTLEHVEIDFKLQDKVILITAKCKTRSRTGVEIEVMTAASVAALTIYDMCKPIDRSAVISQIKLIEKRGGRSGYYKRK